MSILSKLIRRVTTCLDSWVSLPFCALMLIVVEVAELRYIRFSF